MTITSKEDALSDVERMQARINNINNKMQIRAVAGKRIDMHTKEQIEYLAIMQKQLRKIKSNQSKKGIRKDNPTLSEA